VNASVDTDGPVESAALGRFTRISVQTPAGEIEARLSDMGNWELRVRRNQDKIWRLACTGDLDCGAVTSLPAVSATEETIRLGPLAVDPVARLATVNGEKVDLTNKEFALLLMLASQPDRVFSISELLQSIWGHIGTAPTRTVNAHASRLRNKLKRAGAESMILNCWGVGYRMWDRRDLISLPPLSPVGEAV
jgi:DNA-binding response OmpR family regulator